MSEIEMQSHVLLKCIRERGKLRVRILTAGYNNVANCQFPRDVRIEGCHFKVKAMNIRLINTRGKFYYSIARSAVEVLGNDPDKSEFEGVRLGPKPKGATTTGSTSSNVVDPANMTVFEDDRTEDCCICMAVEKNIVFNCGHLYTCRECSLLVHSCPICRQRITQRIDKKLFG
jgi:hypothetical protein